MASSTTSSSLNSPLNESPQITNRIPGDHQSQNSAWSRINSISTGTSAHQAVLPSPTISTHALPHGEHAQLNQRSCITCRRRKVRCSKRDPCSNCVKAGIECVFPGPGRAPRKPKRPQDAELLARLRRLEGVVESLGANPNEPINAPVSFNDPPAPTSDGQSKESPAREGRTCAPFMDRDPKALLPHDTEHEFGRLVIDEGKSRYVSNRFWASLGDEIEEMQDILDPSSGEEEDYPSPEDSTNSGAHDGFLFGYASLAHTLRNYYPTPTQLFVLWKFYQENVAPLITILHQPSLRMIIVEASANAELLDKNTEALLFSVYFSAVISMTPQQCTSQLGEDRDVLLHRYRFAVEQSLARAGLLNSQNLMLLQAAVLFLICVRRHDDTRFVWTMTAVVLRLAQGLGLHRDGTNFGLKPFETEMRRRLWWHIVLLDVRSSEDHGTDPQVHEAFFDTRLPLNINDDDISPDMTDPPEERLGGTEMTFTLVRCEVNATVRRLSYIPPGVRGVAREPTIEEREALVEALSKRLEERYIRHCDMNVPLFWVCATIARLIIAKLWLVVHHPLVKRDTRRSLPMETRDRLFATSIEVIEFARLMANNENTSKWSWLFRTYIQWHAIAFILAELCVRPPCPGVDRAWTAVNSVYREWEAEATQKKGMLWRPLSRLMRRATAFRAQQQELLRAQFGQNPPTNQPVSALGHAPGFGELPGIPDQLHHVGSPSSRTQPSPSAAVQSQQANTMDTTLEIDLRKGIPDIINEMFGGSQWLAGPTVPTQSSQGLIGTFASYDAFGNPIQSREIPNSQSSWPDWDQVVHEFQMDVQQADGPPPMGDVSDWFA
ncbi:C6 transcription factor, putative [Paecilomyces variotii No. 5]|uniref:C6 transcription factor, putative n=1 Tax=Byssochlamys spectabilis (strain No. 5 / NBRC 109023) TaxID=1356009 RepID=V5FVS8_BYSSN|nr:C6 transcription factor, putative [Paecilomyces variotii No. 5]